MSEDFEIEGVGPEAAATRTKDKRRLGEALLSLSDLEKRLDLSPSEATCLVIRAALGRINRTEGEFTYFDFITAQRDVFTEQAEILDAIFRREAIKAAH